MYYEHNGNFGRRELHKLLLKKGVIISEHKISKILQLLELKSKYVKTKGKNVHTSTNTEKYIAENIYLSLCNSKREEDKELLKKEIWSMDFTEQKVEGKKVTTCGIISVNRKILIAKFVCCKNNAEDACRTVEKGLQIYGAPYMIMTDRGSPFTSKSFHELLVSNGIIHSMSRPHTPRDNRYIETFWKTMKIELGKVEQLNYEQYKIILDYYKYYYNNIRPHSTLNYLTPMEYANQNVI